MQTFRKGKLYSLVIHQVAQRFDEVNAHYVTENFDELEEGECVIYIRSLRGGWPATLWCHVLTKFGVREIRKECLKKEI
jgi:hypothetical protein